MKYLFAKKKTRFYPVILVCVVSSLAMGRYFRQDRHDRHDESKNTSHESISYGEMLFSKHGCVACHSVDGTTKNGPSLRNIFGGTVLTTEGVTLHVDEAYIIESILDPETRIVAGFPAVMPPYRRILTQPEIDGLVEFIKKNH